MDLEQGRAQGKPIAVAQMSRGSDRLAIDGYGGFLDRHDPEPRSVQHDSGVLAEYVLSLKYNTVALVGADRVFLTGY